MTETDQSILASGKRTILIEQEAVGLLAERIDEAFLKACRLLLGCTGRVIVTGMGKSGHIGRKLAATLASTGTPAFFVHAGEASHGDFGMISNDDIVIAISYSGSAQEITTLLPLLSHKKLPLISLTGNPESVLASAAWVNLDISVKQEACPMDLAPTASTTATLAMCDAIAVALLEAKGFTANDFAFSHPGGKLGKRLLLKVADIMHTGDSIPVISENAMLSEALVEMSAKSLGMTTVVDDNGLLSGVFTDGDLRRLVDRQPHFTNLSIKEAMSVSPSTITKDMMAIDALQLMELKSITALIVTNEQQKPIGVVHLHDLLRSGIV